MHTFSQELDAVPPYSFELTVHNPAGWFWHNPLEVYEAGRIWTALHLSPGKAIGLRLESLGILEKPKILATIFSRRKLTNRDENEVIEMVREGAGLRDNILEFYEAVKTDPILKHTIHDLYGMRRGAMLRTDIFNSATLAITLQNAPINRTDQMLQLLITNCGQKMTFDGKTTYTWPSPKSIMNADAEELTKKCKLGYRTKYLQFIAVAVQRQTCPKIKELLEMPFEKAKAELTKLKGIGEYSSEIILPHGQAFPIDIWSAQIFHKLFFPHRPLPSKQEAVQIVRKQAAERWGRWRRLAFVYVLSDLDNLSQKLKVNL